MYFAPTARTILSVVLACLWLAGCSKLVTVELSPKVLAQDCTSDHDSNATACLTPCPLATMGTACNGPGESVVPANSLKEFAAPADAVVVGWGDRYNQRTCCATGQGWGEGAVNESLSAQGREKKGEKGSVPFKSRKGGYTNKGY